jgi:hypothetical protein
VVLRQHSKLNALNHGQTCPSEKEHNMESGENPTQENSNKHWALGSSIEDCKKKGNIILEIL